MRVSPNRDGMTHIGVLGSKRLIPPPTGAAERAGELAAGGGGAALRGQAPPHPPSPVRRTGGMDIPSLPLDPPSTPPPNLGSRRTAGGACPRPTSYSAPSGATPSVPGPPRSPAHPPPPCPIIIGHPPRVVRSLCYVGIPPSSPPYFFPLKR